MRYYQVINNGERRVAVETGEDTLIDLTTLNPNVRGVLDLLRAASIMETDIDTVAARLLDQASDDAAGYSVSELHTAMTSGRTAHLLTTPISAPEVWAAGVTYQDSMRERQAESGSPDVYARVYDADRPEVFFKATAARLVPPFGPVGIRADSDWNVPEPELAFILAGGRIVGYTAGNDMSSRSIEGANPLYLPQAKLYDRACAIGPCMATPEAVGDPQDLQVALLIERNGAGVFQGTTSTSKMKRNCAYIADWLQRHNHLPDGSAVLTGTGIIPPPDFTLKEGDIVTVEVEKIGRLVNPVVVV